jgi:ABC-type antimicrobial peptide transport system permease subunit
MLDESSTLNLDTPDAPPPEEKSNRTFLIVGGVMAGLVFLTLVCMAVYFLVIAPRTAASRAAQQATIEAGNAQAATQLASTSQAALWTPTLIPDTPVPPGATSTVLVITPTVSPTPVVALGLGTLIPTATTDPATLVAMQTELAVQMTAQAQAATATYQVTLQGMPATGFFDDIGLPSTIVLALALVAVIFLARRMRRSPAK